MVEICYNEDFWHDFEILMWDKDRIENTEEDANNIISLLNIKKKSEVLDVCCGFGRHSNYFAKAGLNVTGIDITPSYIERAIKSRGSGNNPDFRLQDLLKFNDLEKYHYAFNLYTSFGLLESEDDEITGIENVFNSLKPGGKYLIDIQGKELLIRDFEENIWFESGGVKVLLEYSIINCFTTLRSRWIYYKDETMHETTFDTRVYTALEMAKLLSEAGFSQVEFFGDFKGSPYDMKAKRLIVVATK